MENQTFAIAADGVDPSRVPYKTLHTGARIPCIGIGTFGSDRFSDEVLAEVKGAMGLDYFAGLR